MRASVATWRGMRFLAMHLRASASWPYADNYTVRVPMQDFGRWRSELGESCSNDSALRIGGIGAVFG